MGQACNHVAALLFFIEYHAQDDELPIDQSKTSLPMRWNQPPKKAVIPACANDMTFVKPCYGDTPEAEASQSLCRSDFDPCRIEDRVLQKESLNKLLTCLKETLPNTGLQQFWEPSPYGASQSSETLWHHVIFTHKHASIIPRDKFFTPTVSQSYDHLSHMKLSFDEVSRIEMATRGQSDNDLWCALRSGRITSSRFGEILHRRESTNSRRLVKDLMGYSRPMTTLPPQIRWGRENEERARKCYVANRCAVGEMMVVEESGLHLMPDKSYLGASSDGNVLCTSVDTCCMGCLEIKYSYSIDKSITIEMSPMEIAEKYGSKFFMKRGEDGELHLLQEHPYYAQVQGELAITNREWCDFVVFSNGEIVIDRILADLDYWNELEEKLEEFYVHHLLPEILSGKIFLEEYSSV